ncbi:hypothetical protein GCK72_025000 [Caenorhabditis remanei]|uniref:Uncharacterized protein n=1 Tax=Caenorhabditis remanei TaxID=31234 RepID=A0A6A5G161_CAERE|nr:hypothetical protein GCK72_025000 [Caenorhabditis remanei]KAF1748533.1 hypothetical protein GCK72_025000 [Caenorhabditis remanei]
MRTRHLVLLSSLLFGISLTNSNGTEVSRKDLIYLNKDIDAFVSALSIASSASADGLFALHTLGPRLTLLMKTGIPIAAMVFKNPNPKPATPEYVALTEFIKRKNQIFHYLDENIVFSNSIISQIQKSDYVEKIELPLRRMMNVTEMVLDPVYQKSEVFIKTFKQNCILSDYAPASILEFLDYCVVRNCRKPVTQKDGEDLVKHRAYLLEVLLRLNVGETLLPDPSLFISEFKTIHDQLLDKKLLNEDLKVFDMYFRNYSDAMEVFFQEIRERGSIKETGVDDCLLRALIEVANFNNVLVEKFALKLISELIDTYLATICAEVVFNGHAESVEEYSRRILGSVHRISTHTSDYLNKSLNSAWPAVYHGILSSEIKKIMSKKSSGYVGDVMKIVADLSHPMLLVTGVPKYDYEMAVIRSEDEKYELYFEETGNGKYCSLKRNVNGFNIILGRIKLDFANITERHILESKMARLNETSEKLIGTIDDEMDNIYAAANLSVIVHALKKKIDVDIISELNWHCWSIVRKWKYFSCPTIESYVLPYPVYTAPSISSVDYLHGGRFYEDCEQFRFIFFS